MAAMPLYDPVTAARIREERLFRVAAAEAPVMPREVDRLLTMAYQRPCGVCRHIGVCAHREPAVELALLGVIRHGSGK